MLQICIQKQLNPSWSLHNLTKGLTISQSCFYKNVQGILPVRVLVNLPIGARGDCFKSYEYFCNSHTRTPRATNPGGCSIYISFCKSPCKNVFWFVNASWQSWLRTDELRPPLQLDIIQTVNVSVCFCPKMSFQMIYVFNYMQLQIVAW